MSTGITTEFNKIRAALSRVSPSFCLAKWNYLALYLQSGIGKSCCIPEGHTIPLQGLQENPALFHNTPEKIKARSEMLAGLRPKECSYCWVFEDSSTSKFSDRILKSTYQTQNEIETIKKDPFSKSYLPKMLEISFGNLCNLKCVYCGPNQSSQWEQELNYFGEIPSVSMTKYLISEENNPYLKPFWDWWPELKKNLVLLKLTGGEPFLSKTVYQLLEDISKGDPMPFTLVINTNLASSKFYFNKNILILKKIYDLKKVKNLKIVTSMESIGNRAEYIRSGLNFDLFLSNLSELLDLSFCDISITATINVLSVGSFYTFYEKISELKLKHKERKFRFFIDTAVLQGPKHLNILNHSRKIKLSFLEELNRILSDKEKLSISEYEAAKITSTLNLIYSKIDKEDPEASSRLILYLNELDKRRNTNFKEIFPELHHKYNYI